MHLIVFTSTLNVRVRGQYKQILKHQNGQHDINHALYALTAFFERYLGQQIFGPKCTGKEHCAHKQ